MKLNLLLDVTLLLAEVMMLDFGHFEPFLDASSHLYKRVCPSIRRSIGPSGTLSLGRVRGASVAEYSALFHVLPPSGPQRYRKTESDMNRM